MRANAMMGLVRRLLTHEASKAQDQEPLTSDQESMIEAAERVSDKLNAHLSKRVGQEGFRTLLARALSLTKSNFPHLSAASVGVDGSLVGLRGAIGLGSQKTEHSEARDNSVEGAVALVAHLFGLLIAFIGEDLTLRMLSTVWPDLALDGATVGENGTL